MTYLSLEEKLQAMDGPVKMARSSQAGMSAYLEVPAEYSNWRDEQLAWRETAALLDLSHHMTDLTLIGPDAIPLLSRLAVNSFHNFAPGKAKQFVCCNSDGHMIGDGILFYLGENRVSLLGLPAAHNWVQYHVEGGDYNVTFERDELTGANPTGRRKLYRYQIQGPNALKILERATGAAVPEIKFFHIGEIQILGRTVRALRHGMAGAPGLELFGQWDERNEVRGAILKAGSEFGLREVGRKAYRTTALESGWIPFPVPAIFHGQEMKPYRRWLPGSSVEGVSSLGGSYDSQNIRDYYHTPYELGYGPLIKFDHDFVGRAALESIEAVPGPRRRKVTLAWNPDDVIGVMRTLFEKDRPAKYIDLPFSGYALWHYDKVLRDGNLVGVSRHTGYSYNERTLLSLAVIDESIAIGTEVTLIWGESGGGSARPVVERHNQVQIRAIVSSCPYSTPVRTSYAPGWRTATLGG